jgi:hypothetical protein
MARLANTQVVGLTNWETIGNNTENSIGNIVMEQKLEIRRFQSFHLEPPHLEKKKRMDFSEDID